MDIEGQKNFKKPPLSYWIDSTTQARYPVLKEDINADVAIIGGGFAGIATAYMLGKHGIRAVVLEAGHILQGTTGHTTAKITSQHGLIYDNINKQMSGEFAKQYASANESAIRMIEDIAHENNIECDYIPQSAYIYTLEDKYVGKISDETKTASSLGIKAVYLEEIPLPFPVKAAVRFDGQAQFHPLKFLLPLAEIAVKNGCRIFENSRIVDIEEDGGYVLTSGEGKKVTAEKVIISSHYPMYNKHGMYFTRIYTVRSYITAVKVKEKFPGGMYITAEEPGRSLRSQMSSVGELILAGGEHHKTGQSGDTTKHYEALIDFANEIFTVEDVPYRWSAQDCMTMDDVPFVGNLTSDTPNMYVATGFGKWGMTNSIASSMILSDLIVKGESPWQDVYSPSRKTIAASAKNFVVENLNVAQHLVGGKLGLIPENESLKPGEGKVVEVDGQRAGAFRDEKWNVHVVNTTCTHMGCELNWNSAERSWDCPCHGSRFSCEGEVIEGPALRPLDMDKDTHTTEKLIKDDF